MHGPPDARRDRVADYERMLLIRRMEERILELFEQGAVAGTTHTCIGQEANALAVMGQLDPARDHVLSNHRNHGHYVAFGGDVGALLAEVAGRPEGICGGRGGSQHIKAGNFLSNGVQGGIAPLGVGLALGMRHRGTGGVAVVCLGDGTLGEGVVYEALNMAALWSLPVLFLVEDNGFAQTTPVALGVAGSIDERGRPFGIECRAIDSSDLDELAPWAAECIATARGGEPVWAVVHTCRLAPHSKGDDTRSPEELQRIAARDPVQILGMRLSDEERARADASVAEALGAAVRSVGLEGAS